MATKTETKAWYESKTVWANILLIVAGVAGGFAGLLSSGIPITAIAVMNLVLRVISKSELKW